MACTSPAPQPVGSEWTSWLRRPEPTMVGFPWLVAPEAEDPPQLLALGASVECPPWQKNHPVSLVRLGAERDTFHLLECDGSVTAEAIDRLSVLMRPPGAARPELPLPAEAAEGSINDEWLAGIRLAHPRLVWALAQIAAAFPFRPIYVVSGYRPDASQGSYHRRGRAIDIQIVGVPNELPFAVCRKLRDVGCGYYPNNRFIHVDVRPFATGHPVWVDIAGPGQPSQYVDAWPGVVEGGALRYAGEP